MPQFDIGLPIVNFCLETVNTKIAYLNSVISKPGFFVCIQYYYSWFALKMI